MDNSFIDGRANQISEGQLDVGLRDSEVLGVIEEEELTCFTFEGLKRRMAAHPETLSRTLERLEEQDFLEKSTEGYKLTQKGRGLMNVHPLLTSANRISLVRTLLPPSVSVEMVVNSLEGRWFGDLRWLGRSQTPSEDVLKWVTADGRIQLDAILAHGELRIEGRLLRGEDVAGAIRASYQLVNQISKACLGPAHGPISFMSN